MMKASRVFALSFASIALLSVFAADARKSDPPTYCMQQLNLCLMTLVEPQNCYQEYQRCMIVLGVRGAEVITPPSRRD
jgi:hypothetical protein